MKSHLSTVIKYISLQTLCQKRKKNMEQKVSMTKELVLVKVLRLDIVCKCFSFFSCKSCLVGVGIGYEMIVEGYFFVFFNIKCMMAMVYIHTRLSCNSICDDDNQHIFHILCLFHSKHQHTIPKKKHRKKRICYVLTSKKYSNFRTKNLLNKHRMKRTT